MLLKKNSQGGENKTHEETGKGVAPIHDFSESTSLMNARLTVAPPEYGLLGKAFREEKIRWELVSTKHLKSRLPGEKIKTRAKGVRARTTKKRT